MISIGSSQFRRACLVDIRSGEFVLVNSFTMLCILSQPRFDGPTTKHLLPPTLSQVPLARH